MGYLGYMFSSEAEYAARLEQTKGTDAYWDVMRDRDAFRKGASAPEARYDEEAQARAARAQMQAEQAEAAAAQSAASQQAQAATSGRQASTATSSRTTSSTYPPMVIPPSYQRREMAPLSLPPIAGGAPMQRKKWPLLLLGGVVLTGTVFVTYKMFFSKTTAKENPLDPEDEWES
jgi:hypothetical protein